MADESLKFEQKLKEFTEVHGTVLLGMHRELQSLTKTVNDSVNRELGEFKFQANDALEQIQAKSITIADQLDQSSKILLQIKELNIVTLDAAEQKISSFSTKIQETESNIRSLVFKTEEEIKLALKESMVDFLQELKTIKKDLEFYILDIKRALEKELISIQTEFNSQKNDLLNYFVKEKQIIRDEFGKVKELEDQTLKLLNKIEALMNETSAKIVAHQEAERVFNIRMRIYYGVLALIIFILVYSKLG